MVGERVGRSPDTRAAAVPAIVLAAGASTRMGRPKAELLYEGRRFIEWVVSGAKSAGCAPIVVVVGATQLDVPTGSRRVVNSRWRRGALSSLQCGLAALIRGRDALAPACSGALVCTVDRPRVAVSTIRALLYAHLEHPDQVWQPRHGQRSGHPIVWPRDLLERLLTLDAEDPDMSPRTLLRSPGTATRRRFVEVDDPGTLENIDRPRDLSTLRGND